MPAHKQWTKEQDEYLKENYLVMTYLEIGRKIGKTKGAVSTRAKSLGYKKKFTFVDKKDEIIKLAKEGKSVSEIALSVNFEYSPVLEYINKNGIEVSNRGSIANISAANSGFEEPPAANVDYSELTIMEWFKRWYHAYRREDVREQTRQKYRTAYDHLAISSLGNRLLIETTREHVQAYINAFGANRSKQTVYDHLQYIRSCLKDAVIDGHIKQNPASNIKAVYREQKLSVMDRKEIRETKKWLEIDEYQKFRYYMIFWLQRELENDPIHTVVKNVKSIPYQITYMTIFLTLKTGARMSEVLGVTRSDVLFDTDEINIDKTWDYKNNEGGTFSNTKNISSIRKISVDQETVEILQTYINWLDKHKIKMSENTLFVPEGRRIHNSSINLILTGILRDLKIETITMHKLRHTQASYLIAKGVPLQVVAKRLGHTDTNMIQRVYGHLLKETEQKGNKMILELI